MNLVGLVGEQDLVTTLPTIHLFHYLAYTSDNKLLMDEGRFTWLKNNGVS